MQDTDDDLMDLLLIPGIGRAKARALHAAGYENAADIAKADPSKLSKVPGISLDMAKDIIKFVSRITEKGEDINPLETTKELLICPMCGSMVSGSSNVCSGCGITFSDEVEELDGGISDAPAPAETKEQDGFWYKEQNKLFICPECGSMVSDASGACPKCGVHFDEEEEDSGDLPVPADAPSDADGFWYKEDTTLFMCPNCGSFIKKDANSCGSCGIVFEAGEDDDVAPEPGACPMCKSPISPEMETCKECGFDFTKEKDKDGFWYKDQTELCMCPGCGAFIPKSASQCGMCGLALEEGEEEAPVTPECPMCKGAMAPGADTCSNCGFDFTTEKENDGFWYKDSGTLFICPGCGAFLSSAAESCLNCGLVFEADDSEDMKGEKVEPSNSLDSKLEQQVDELIELIEIEDELETAANGGESDKPGDASALPDATVSTDSLYLCPICGAFVQSSMLRCPSCSTVFDDIEDVKLEPVSPMQDLILDPRELAREMAAEIEDIEAELLEEPKHKPAEKKGGVSKDFLDRWRKLDSENAQPVIDLRKTPEADRKARKEIEELEDILVLEEPDMRASAGDGETDGFWAEKARELASRGRVEEAVAFLDRGVELNPEREMEYKRLMLELMGVGANEQPTDLSELVAIDDIGELAVDEVAFSQKNLERLDEIEMELLGDPDNGALWQEKGELFEKLGRHEEAIACFDRSIGLSYSELRKEQRGTASRREQPLGIGLTNGQGRVNGRVNGLLIQRGLVNGGRAGITNGKTNGLTNGRVNGLRIQRGLVNGRKPGMIDGKVNGLTNGRVNGLKEGRVNGISKGLAVGRVNGLTNGLTNGDAIGLINGNGLGLINGGLVNGMGLVNGEGMVNGAGSFRRLRQRRRERMIWRHRLTAMVLLVAFVLMIPMLGNLMLQNEAGRIAIDGNFADWNQIGGYYNFMSEDLGPNMGILETKMSLESGRLGLFISLGTDMFSHPDGGASSVWILVDADSDIGTGYAMQDMGIDLMAEIYGWNGTVAGSSSFKFDNNADRDDWNGFTGMGPVSSASSGNMLEVNINIPRDMAQLAQSPRVHVIALDQDGNSDITSYLMMPEGAGTVAGYKHGGPDIIQTGAAITWGQVTLSTHSGDAATFSGLEFNITGNGNAADIINPGLRMANGQMFHATVIATDNGGFRLIFAEPLTVPLNNTITLTLEAEVPGQSAGKTLGISLAGVMAEGRQPRIRNTNAKLHNVGIPNRIGIDGAFGDWANAIGMSDPSGDVLSPGRNITFMNSNIDLAEARFSIADDSLFFFLSVNGIMMGGENLPTVRYRPGNVPPTEFTDSDRDTVPDNLDPHPFDFTNNGVLDIDMTTAGGAPDVDGDGIADYPRGPDWWLNTTIPDDYPEPYAGSAVSIYIGPIDTKHIEQKGDDRAYMLIDSDDNPQTGQSLKGGVGIDRVIIVSGKNNHILASELYRQDPNQPTGWAFVRNLPAAVDWMRMEGAAMLADLGLVPGNNFTIFISLEDWRGAHDLMEQPTRQEVDGRLAGSTRSTTGDDVVLNEISGFGTAEWVELCNPTAYAISLTGWTIQVQTGGIGNYRTAYSFTGAVTIGAFGSGSEYLVVNLNNWIPDNKVSNIRLASGPIVTDVVACPVPVSGATYARFRNATYGMPQDSDAAQDWYSSAAPTGGAPNDRRSPLMSVAKSGNVASVAPGGSVIYYIWYNNTGEGNAKNVWINDTLPVGMSFVSSSAPYSSISGQEYGWHFTQVSPGMHLLTLTAMVDTGLVPGATLTNNVMLEYTDQLSRPWGSSSDSYDIEVMPAAPVLTLAKTADISSPFPNEIVTFTIYYNNTGTVPAPHVWLNDTLPAGLTYVSANPMPSLVSGQSVGWYMQDVGVGINYVTIQARVGSAVAPGTVLTNAVTADYKDSTGASQPQLQAQSSVTVFNPAISILINEISSIPNPEWIELCNPSAETVNIGNWVIQYLQGNWKIALTIPAGTTIGAWGSGSEYAIISFNAGTLSDQGTSVRILNAGGQVIDETTYPKIAAGQSWARYKHEDTGKPIDTGSAADFYVSNNGWILPEGPTPGGANDRKRPVMSVEKAVAPILAEPGQTITYTITLRNTGDGNAKNVWVNDTLPTGVGFISATPAPASISGQSLVWYLASIGHGTVIYITLTAKVNSLPADGEVVTNIVSMAYSDALKRPMGTGTAWASFTCARPQITVEKVADVTNVLAGGTIVYTIYYNNTGSATAGSVWINDTLPTGVALVSATPAPSFISGQDILWHLTNVAPGVHSITITVSVNSNATGTLTNWAYLDYSSGYGYGLESSSDSVDVIIPEMRHLALPIIGIMLIGFITLKKRRDEDGKDI